jgi:pilus assembly protein TadC
MGGIWAIIAGAVVAAATYFIWGIGIAERTRVERMLGVSPERTSSSSGARRVIEALGDLGIMDPFDAILAPRGGDIASRRRARGIALIFGVLTLLLAIAASPFWVALLVVVPLFARAYVERELRQDVERRRRELERDVTPAIDVFVLALDAGLPFERALTSYTESVDGALAREPRATVRELEIGYRRREALDQLVARTRSEALAKLAASVRLAEEFGTPLAGALRSLAVDMRAERRQRLQEAALRAPITMLLPTAGFILVPMFLIVLGPVAIRIATGRLF